MPRVVIEGSAMAVETVLLIANGINTPFNGVGNKKVVPYANILPMLYFMIR